MECAIEAFETPSLSPAEEWQGATIRPIIKEMPQFMMDLTAFCKDMDVLYPSAPVRVCARLCVSARACACLRARLCVSACACACAFGLQ